MKNILAFTLLTIPILVYAETNITQTTSINGDITINGSTESIVGQQVVILGNSEDNEVELKNIAAINNCEWSNLIGKSNGKGKIKIIHTEENDIVPKISILYTNGEVKSLPDSSLKYKVTESTIKIYSDNNIDVVQVILEIKQENSINFISIPFYKKAKFTQTCSKINPSQPLKDTKE